MVRARRTRRAAAEDLYRTCKQAGTCPPDVIAKIERKTVADRILQWGAAGTFFGGLGIGTGSGRGGASGYIPLGGGGRGPGVNIGAGGRTVRPPIPVDALGPSEVLPVDALDPAIVPLVDGSATDVSVIEGGLELQPIPPEVPVDTVPAVSTEAAGAGDGYTVAVLHVPPEATPPSRSSVSWSQFSNPAFDVAPDSTHGFGETSSSHNIFVTEGGEGIPVGEGADDIPLVEFRTSTPRPTGPRPRVRGRGYPQRFYERVVVTDPAFLNRPGSLVQFGFDNPVYDDTLEFPVPEEPQAAPDPDFTDIYKLSSARLSEVDGRVRVSRYGSRAGISTRSGTRIGSQVHFYHDISDIQPAEEVELSVLGETSDADPITVSDVTNTLDVAMDEDAFETITLDSLTSADLDSRANSSWEALERDDVPLIQGRLSFGQGRNRQTIEVVVRPSTAGGPVDYDDVGVYIDYPDDTAPRRPSRPNPLPPTVVVGYFGGVDYSLHPSLMFRRRRRRKRYIS
ncbi:L2 [Canis familiaris papillomavirus 14]|uniref:Minor capsid protein L2 n=1 Tax=Canis familiaris papillomavirus 14 TaxID=1236767 RepID=K7QHA0_9PAPI|nr:L2 [Canis familiaris papillomavirus 14]AFU07678.1 L2 [Canis familiaris papillomavirus 14]